MRTQSMDTAPEIERIQIARIRTFSLPRKFATIRSSTETLAFANQSAIHPAASPSKSPSSVAHAASFVARQYDPALATAFVAAVHDRPAWSLDRCDMQDAMLRVIAALTGLGCQYALSGQLACALYGFPRAVFALEVLTDVPAERIAALAAVVQPDMLVHEACREACRPGLTEEPADRTARGAAEVAAGAAGATAERGRDAVGLGPMRPLRLMRIGPRWRLLHLSSLVNVDLLRPQKGTFAQHALGRAHPFPLLDGVDPVRVVAPEDVVLLDLLDFMDLAALRRSTRPQGGQPGVEADVVSALDDDRWNDLLGLLKVQAPALDVAALDRAGAQLGVRDLLHRALEDAGLLGLVPGLAEREG